MNALIAFYLAWCAECVVFIFGAILWLIWEDFELGDHLRALWDNVFKK